MTGFRYIAAILLIAFISGCASKIDPAKVKQHQLEVQRMQTAVFETHDRKVVTRGIVAALQDLDFIISEADAEQGLVAAKKFGTYPITMTITTQPISSKQILIHAIAQSNLKTLEDRALYEQFFATVEKYLPLVSRAGD